MRAALLIGPAPMDAAFLEDVMRLAGHDVQRVNVDAVTSDTLYGADAAFASLDTARELGWLAKPRPALPRAVVVSRFPELLAPLADREDLRLLLEPSTPGQVLAAIAPERPKLPDGVLATKFDWQKHDEQLAQLGLDGAAPDAQLGMIAGLAARSLRVPIAYVALVDSARQRFLGDHGLPDDVRRAGGTPRAWSFCQYVVSSDAPLVVQDAPATPTLEGSPLVRFGLVRAYAGVPIRADGVVIGTVCALSSERRSFTTNDLAALELAARAVEARIAVIRSTSSSGSVAPPASSDSPDPREVQTVAPARERERLKDPASEEDLVGATLAGKYLVTARLGEGGMSRVYLARERQLERLVAIKVLGAKLDDEVLLREARQLGAIRHPCIMQLFDWGRLPSGRPYLVLEYVRGESLRDRISALGRARTWLPRTALTRMLRNLSGALETLHGAGLVHGDVKPANVLVDEALDRLVLIDFGLAMNTAETPGAKITGGTLGYSAPEQLDRSSPTAPEPTLDVYALGALAYTLLTFAPPFARLAKELRLDAQKEGAFAAPSRLRPDLGPAVDAVFERALSPDPSARYGTVTALVDALDRALAGHASQPPERTISTQSMIAVVAGEQGEPRTRGGAIAFMREMVIRELGAARERVLVASLSRRDAAVLDEAMTSQHKLLATRAYSAYLRAYSGGDGKRIFALAERLARATAPERLASFQIERAPHVVLRAGESLFHRFHAWGSLRFIRETTDRSRVELTMPAELAPEQCAAFAGAMSGTLQWVRSDVRVREVACVGSGAPACAFDVEWPPA